MSERAIFVTEYTEGCNDNNVTFAFRKSIMKKEIKKLSYKDLREITNIFCDFSFKIFFICYGILQFYAIWGGFIKVFHHSNIFISFAAFILGFLPFIGTILGIWAAQLCWGWSLSNSLAIFLMPYIIVNSPILMIISYETYKDLKRWKAEEKMLKKL